MGLKVEFKSMEYVWAELPQIRLEWCYIIYPTSFGVDEPTSEEDYDIAKVVAIYPINDRRAIISWETETDKDQYEEEGDIKAIVLDHIKNMIEEIEEYGERENDWLRICYNDQVLSYIDVHELKEVIERDLKDVKVEI